MEPIDRLLTVQDLADYLGVPVATIYAWRHRQGPPGFRVGRHLRFRWNDIQGTDATALSVGCQALCQPTCRGAVGTPALLAL
jgi:excisionase family DNA binding protein